MIFLSIFVSHTLWNFGLSKIILIFYLTFRSSIPVVPFKTQNGSLFVRFLFLVAIIIEYVPTRKPLREQPSLELPNIRGGRQDPICWISKEYLPIMVLEFKPYILWHNLICNFMCDVLLLEQSTKSVTCASDSR